MKLELEVEYENGDVRTVFAGQRDMSRWESEKFGGETAMREKPITFARYIAWSATRRAGETTLGWPAWDQTVESVDIVEENDVNPTNEEPQAAT